MVCVPPCRPAPLVRMLTNHQMEPTGNAAVHAACWVKDRQILLVAVNTIGTHTAAEITLPTFPDPLPATAIQEASGRLYGISDNRMEIDFQPYSVKILLLDTTNNR